jgi:hypothetical protein
MKVKKQRNPPPHLSHSIIQFWPSGQIEVQHVIHGLWLILFFFILGINSTHSSMMTPITSKIKAKEEKSMLMVWIFLLEKFTIVSGDFCWDHHQYFICLFSDLISHRKKGKIWTFCDCRSIGSGRNWSRPWDREDHFLPSLLYWGQPVVRATNCHRIICWFDPWPWGLLQRKDQGVQKFWEPSDIEGGLISHVENCQIQG